LDLTLIVDTAASGATTTVTVPLAGTVACTVDWGDGRLDAYTTTGNKTHTYAAGGVYRIRITGSLTGFGAIVSRPELVGAISFGRIELTGLTDGFRTSANLVVAPSILPPAVTSLIRTFHTCSTFNSSAVVGWSTGNITNISETFRNCTVFNQPVGGWDTSKVTNMAGTFDRCYAFDQPVAAWDVRAVTTMAGMFDNIFGAASFDQPLGTWRPSRCTSFTNFLRSVTLSTANYDDLLEGWTDFTGSGWDTGSITAFADPGGGQVTVTTDAAHGYANNHVMRITGTTNYDGSYVISSVTATTFEITATFVATETGTWNATLQSGVTFSGGGSEYSVGAATTARGVLTGAPYSWTITDGGQA
jgi:surface protein